MHLCLIATLLPATSRGFHGCDRSHTRPRTRRPPQRRPGPACVSAGSHGRPVVSSSMSGECFSPRITPVAPPWRTVAPASDLHPALRRCQRPSRWQGVGPCPNPYPVVKAEYTAMELARRAGIDAAPVELAQALGREVLMVERFDRTHRGARRMMVSALTILQRHDAHGIAGRYATYADLAHQIRSRFTDADSTLREMFSRIVFNILVSNTDDHASNHSAFWDGANLTLTPAYDICPQARAGGEAAQAMAFGSDGGPSEPGRALCLPCWALPPDSPAGRGDRRSTNRHDPTPTGTRSATSPQRAAPTRNGSGGASSSTLTRSRGVGRSPSVSLPSAGSSAQIFDGIVETRAPPCPASEFDAEIGLNNEPTLAGSWGDLRGVASERERSWSAAACAVAGDEVGDLLGGDPPGR